MTDDKKLKHETVNQIRYYWNLALFARRFEVEVDAPPEVVAEQFANMKQSPSIRGVVHGLETVVDVTDGAKSYDFSIQNSETRQPIVNVTGRIIYSEGYNQTIVRGDIRLSGTYLIKLGIPYAFAFFLMIQSSFVDVALALCIFIPMVLFSLISFAPIKRQYDILTLSIQAMLNDIQQFHMDDSREINVNLQKPSRSDSAKTT